MPSNPPVIEISDLNVRYGRSIVLRDVNMTVPRGALASLIGPNGAGKSTLLKTILGLVPKEEGAIVCHTDKIGYVPQQLPVDTALPLTVAEFLSLKVHRGPFWFGRLSKSDRVTAEARLSEIGAGHLIDRQIGRLSGGEFQRVLIAYALLNDPELLLLDEPLTGVDIRGGLSFDGLLHHLHDHRKITILMVSHDLHLVEHVSDVVYCINGALCCSGDPREILKPEALAKAYGHLPGLHDGTSGSAFIPLKSVR